VRRRLRLEERDIGDVVFSTADSPEEATERDLEAFDRSLAGADENLGRYLPATDRIAFEDDFELVAFDEELRSAAAR
jgi:hypothetical protein